MPSICFVLLSPFRIWFVGSENVKILSNKIRWLKLVSSTLLINYGKMTRKILNISDCDDFINGPPIRAFGLLGFTVNREDADLYCSSDHINFNLDMLVACLAILLLVFSTQMTNQTSGAAIGIAMLDVLSFSSSLARLIEYWAGLETAIGAIARLKQLENDVVPEGPVENIQSHNWLSDNGITLSKVSASYEQQFPDVLHDIDLKIDPGEKLGICGRTGSEKSSFISLLLRLLPIRSGSITISGIDISTLPRQTVRDSIIAIPQEPLILSGSVRFNVNPYTADPIDSRSGDSSSSSTDEEAPSDDAIIDVLTKVGLWELILGQGGLSKPISSIGLSNGQKQLFCLARSIFRKDYSALVNQDHPVDPSEAPGSIKPRLLVLDGATSSVDTYTDEIMRRVISSEFSDFTVVTVAHRLSSLAECDRVLVMDDGRIGEVGKPADLLEKEDGLWRRLWEAQHH